MSKGARRRGRRTRSRRRTTTQQTTFLQSIRMALNRVLRMLNKGKNKPKIKKYYGPPGTELNDINSATGLTGTAGAPATPYQGAAELLSQLSKSSQKHKTGQPLSQNASGNIRLEGLAFLTNLSPKIYDDILLFNKLWTNYGKVLFEWEMTLPKGLHKIYHLYDEGQEVVGGFYVTWAIATSETRLKLLSRQIFKSPLKIGYLKIIQGCKVLPSPKTRGPRHPTIRQG